RPTQLPEGQLRGTEGLSPAAAPPARPAGARRPGTDLPECPRDSGIRAARTTGPRSPDPGGGATSAQSTRLRRCLTRPGAQGAARAAGLRRQAGCTTTAYTLSPFQPYNASATFSVALQTKDEARRHTPGAHSRRWSFMNIAPLPIRDRCHALH